MSFNISRALSHDDVMCFRLSLVISAFHALSNVDKQLEQPIRSEIQTLVQQGISHADNHSAELQTVRAELDNVRNQSATLVNQLNAVQNNVQQLQRPAVPATLVYQQQM